MFLILVNSMLLLRYYFGTDHVSYSCKIRCCYYAITLIRTVFPILVNLMLLLCYNFGTDRVSHSCKFDVAITLLL